MKKNLASISLFAFLLFCSFSALDILYTKTIASKPINKIIWIFNKHNENYDFAVLGDSRVLNVVNVKAMQNDLHLKGVNLGTPGSKPVENYLVLNRFIKTNRVNTVLLQLDATIGLAIVSPHNAKLPFYETFAFMPYIHDPDVYSIITQYTSPVKYLCWKYIPFMRYAEFNDEYSPDKIFKKQEQLYDETGYARLFKIVAKPLIPDSSKMARSTPDSLININLAWVKEIINTCKYNHIRLVIFTSPFHKTEFAYPLTAYALDRLHQFSRDNNVTYWDWSKQFMNASDSVYADSFHTNYLVDEDLAKMMADSIACLKPNAP